MSLTSNPSFRSLLSKGGRLFVCLALAACTEKRADVAPTVGEVKQAFAEREKRLSSFRIEVDSTQGEHQARHWFAWRTPSKSRGHLFAPQEVELAFDGTRLVRTLYPPNGAPVSELLPVDLPPVERAFFLASTFLPFAPEGFRTPLLPMTGITSKRTTHALAPEAVELTVSPGEGVQVVYVLRWPGVDFLEKRTSKAGETRVLKVVKESCDAKLKLCVPTSLVETLRDVDGGEGPLGTTVVTKVELNVELPQDFFSPPVTPPPAPH